MREVALGALGFVRETLTGEANGELALEANREDCLLIVASEEKKNE
jgi:hypothetical protein